MLENEIKWFPKKYNAQKGKKMPKSGKKYFPKK
jgi:hypothetical protein